MSVAREYGCRVKLHAKHMRTGEISSQGGER